MNKGTLSSSTCTLLTVLVGCVSDGVIEKHYWVTLIGKLEAIFSLGSIYAFFSLLKAPISRYICLIVSYK